MTVVVRCQVFTPNPNEYIIERESEQESERERERKRERERETEATTNATAEEGLRAHPLYQYA